MKYLEAIMKLVPHYGTNEGHGHVWNRPDGMVARCAGPDHCFQCKRDRAALEAADERIECTIVGE